MPPIDVNQLQALIAALSQMGGGVNPTLMASAYPANVSPSGVKSSLSPEILLSSGLVSPETLNQLTAGELGNLQAKYAGQIQSQLPYEASSAVLAPVTGKYLGNDTVSAFMRSAFDKIATGAETPDSVIARISSSSNTPPEVKSALATVTADLDAYGKLNTSRNSALAKYEYEQQGKVNTLGPAPTADTARMSLYDKLGVPQLALLGDPNQAYQFDPSSFVDRTKLAKANDVLRQALMAKDVVRGNTGGAVQQGKLQDVYTMKSIEELARKAGEKAVSGMQQGPTTGDFARAIGGAIMPFVGGGLNFRNTLQNKQDELNAAMDAARQAAMEKERARLMADLVPTSDESMRIKYSPEYRNALANVTKAKSAVSMENAYGRLVADALQKRLAAQGITPYTQNVNSLLGYAIQTARK